LLGLAFLLLARKRQLYPDFGKLVGDGLQGRWQIPLQESAQLLALLLLATRQVIQGKGCQRFGFGAPAIFSDQPTQIVGKGAALGLEALNELAAFGAG